MHNATTHSRHRPHVIFLHTLKRGSRFFIEDSDQNFNAKHGDRKVVRNGESLSRKVFSRALGRINRSPVPSKGNVATKKICFREEKIAIFKFEAHFCDLIA